MANEISGSLIIILQVVLLAGNYIYSWNLPWWILWFPAVVGCIGLVIVIVIFAVAVLIHSM